MKGIYTKFCRKQTFNAEISEERQRYESSADMNMYGHTATVDPKYF